jgi:hypothetical protein
LNSGSVLSLDQIDPSFPLYPQSKNKNQKNAQTPTGIMISRWDNLKDFENKNVKPKSIWTDGRIRKK